MFTAGAEVYNSGNSDSEMSSCVVFVSEVSVVSMVTVHKGRLEKGQAGQCDSSLFESTDEIGTFKGSWNT